MLFTPQNRVLTGGVFRVPKEARASAHASMAHPVLAELWRGGTFSLSALAVEPVDALVFLLGDAPLPSPGENDYAVNVTKSGIAIAAKDEKALKAGFMMLIDAMRPEKDGAVVDAQTFAEKPLIPIRMAHICVFPDTKLWEIHKTIRLCGALKYTHVILEFWGMFRYESLAALSWAHAFTKKDLAPLVEEARGMGMEVVPMFNHFGHASQSRVMHGKHVVLDNDPRYAYLFDASGWCWRIGDKDVRALLRSMREELIDLCGDSGYFHIGCDEAYGYVYDERGMETFCEYISEVNADIRSHGRRTILWADMMLAHHAAYDAGNRYETNLKDEETEARILAALPKDVIAADWQYNVSKYPVETALTLKNAGFDVMLCPWDRSGEALDACLGTVKKNGLYGLIHTTWHTLSRGTPYLAFAAMGCFTDERRGPWTGVACEEAALLRKVYAVGGDYEKAGWAKREIEVSV